MSVLGIYVRSVRNASMSFQDQTIFRGKTLASIHSSVTETLISCICRHVRVKHTDRDVDDPALRDVLAQQRSDTSRGKRRSRYTELRIPNLEP